MKERIEKKYKELYEEYGDNAFDIMYETAVLSKKNKNIDKIATIFIDLIENFKSNDVRLKAVENNSNNLKYLNIDATSEEYEDLLIQVAGPKFIYEKALALMYANKSDEFDLKRIVAYLEMAGKGGLNYCYNHLGYLHSYGSNGIKKDLKKAIKYYQKGARLEDINSMHGLSDIYKDKNEDFYDLEKSNYWKNEAILQKNIILSDEKTKNNEVKQNKKR